MFGLEFCDRSFRNIDEAAAFLKVPVIASLTKIVPAHEALARRRRRLAVGLIVLVVMLAALTAATVWYIQGAHTPNDAIDSVRRVLLRIKAYFSG